MVTPARKALYLSNPLVCAAPVDTGLECVAAGMDSPCTLDDFRAFFELHAYDTLGNGSFRPHFVECRDRSEEWAVELDERAERVASASRALAIGVTHALRGAPHVLELFVSAMSRPMPPAAPSGADAAYAPLMGFAWLVVNAECVVRCMVTAWFADSAQGGAKNETYEDVATRMEEATRGDVSRLHRIYTAAHARVRDSVAAGI